MKPYILKGLFIIGICFLLSSCYEDFIVINSTFKSVKRSKDSSQVFFFHYLQAGQPPKGISRFPDGGIHKIIYKNTSLYSFDIKNKELFKIYDFGNLPFNNVLEHISLQNNNITFSISPLMGWDWIRKHSSDSSFIKIQSKYNGFYTCDLETKSLNRFINEGYYPEISPDGKQIIYLKKDTAHIEIWHLSINKNENHLLKNIVDDSPYTSLKWKNNESIYFKSNDKTYEMYVNTNNAILIKNKIDFKTDYIPIKDIKELTSEISFKNWGLNLADFWQKNKNEYLQDIIKLNGNLNYRKAVLQSLSEDLNKVDLEYILEQMQKYEDSLEAYKKTEYKLNSKETKALVIQYLN